MASNLDTIQVHSTNHQEHSNGNDQELGPSKQDPKPFSNNISDLFKRIKTVLNDPIFIELIVVLIVIIGAVLSSELGIHVGKSYS